MCNSARALSEKHLRPKECNWWKLSREVYAAKLSIKGGRLEGVRPCSKGVNHAWSWGP